MKFNINWKELGKQLESVKCKMKSVKWVALIVTFYILHFTLLGCSSMQPSDKTQSISLLALGIPGVAVVTSTQQTADNKGDDMNDTKQTNPVSVKLPTK